MDRRHFLAAAGALAASTASSRANEQDHAFTALLRGSINATELGVVPGTSDDQSRKFQRMLDTASERDQPVMLPAGTYLLSNIVLPRRVRLAGVHGATNIVYGGDGALFTGDLTDLLMLEGLTIDGANLRLGQDVTGLVQARGVEQVAISGCRVIGSARHAIVLEKCGGVIDRCEITGAADAAIYAVESTGLRVSANTISNCGNGGVLVHRWRAAEDGTIVSGNRISGILAQAGGTGQFGNGINIYRADNVIVTDNVVSRCAFSAIRANSASNLLVGANTCSASGETGIYAEFAFSGAVINANIVDGAANGISIVNYNEGGRMAVCSSNIVRNLSRTGPYPADAPGFGTGITVEADTAVTGNVVEGAPRAGIAIGWGPYMRNVVANANVVRAAGVGIAVSVVEGSGSAVITDNVIDQTETGAIVGYRWTQPATGDLALFPANSERLTVERNRTS